MFVTSIGQIVNNANIAISFLLHLLISEVLKLLSRTSPAYSNLLEKGQQRAKL